MKNKTLISFLINLLVGIIFSFPVFSVQLFAHGDFTSNIEIVVCNDERTLEIVSDFGHVAAKLFPKEKLNSFPNPKLFKKNNSPGNTDNTRIISFPPGFREFTSSEISTTIQNLTYTFVNLSYLKDLKITKMLC
ncbi:MAG: hypothetical protein M3R36_03310 [Bacteroidota bacterium]|nr:hypothetical protein [Bacteroidota bacterium]